MASWLPNGLPDHGGEMPFLSCLSVDSYAASKELHRIPSWKKESISKD
jgi:hypothetical protein